MLNKKDIREQIKEKRNRLSKEFISINSNIITEKLLNMDVYKNAKYIYIYMSMDFEVITENIIINALKNNKKVAIPKVVENNLEFYYINNIKDTSIGYYGIQEPINVNRNFCACPNNYNTLIIIPGVAFDNKKHRIGYGKGFYDKYLSKNKIDNKIALAFNFQVLDNIPSDNHDIMPDIIITEKEIIH